MSDQSDLPLVFTEDDLDLIGRTADALSAYMGKPVLAEVMDAEETGYEWVVFATPLDVKDNAVEHVVVQIGGRGARLLGNKGGMVIADGDVYDCRFLWAIQLSDLPGVRYIKVDDQGDEVGWTDELTDILPFALTNEPEPPADDDDSNDADDAGEEPWDPTAPQRPTLH